MNHLLALGTVGRFGVAAAILSGFIAGIAGLAAIAKRRPARPLKGNSGYQRWLSLAFGLMMLAGIGWFVFRVGVPMTSLWLRARHWPTTTATIQSVAVQPPASGKKLYHLVLDYRYTVDGRSYSGTRYDLGISSEQSPQTFDEYARQHHRGSTISVHYDPADPAESVVTTTVPQMLIAGGAVGLFFGLAGVFLLRDGTRPTPLGIVTGPKLAENVRLRDRRRSMVKSTILVIAIGGLGLLTLPPAATKTPAALLFLMPALLLIASQRSRLRTLVAPRVRLTLERHPLRPGDSVKVRYVLGGKAGSLQSMKFVLACTEKAQLKDGRSNKKRIAVRVIDVHRLTAGDATDGEFTLAIPTDAMPTLHAPLHDVEWSLGCQGKFAGRPAATDEFPITLLPTETYA